MLCLRYRNIPPALALAIYFLNNTHKHKKLKLCLCIFTKHTAYRIYHLSLMSDPYRYTPEQSAPGYWPMTLAEANALDLSYMNDSWATDNLRDGLRAVIRANALPNIQVREINVWKYLSEYSPPESHGFMFSAGDSNIVSQVQDQMEIGHSGCSMGWTMRNIEVIAKNGLPAHREMFLNRRNK